MDARLSWPSWLDCIPRWYTHLKLFTHPSINRVGRRLTSFMQRTMLKLPANCTFISTMSRSSYYLHCFDAVILLLKRLGWEGRKVSHWGVLSVPRVMHVMPVHREGGWGICIAGNGVQNSLTKIILWLMAIKITLIWYSFAVDLIIVTLQQNWRS